MAKLSKKVKSNIEELFLHYQKVMRLQDWKISINENILEEDGIYATLTNIDGRDRSAEFNITKKTFEDNFSMDRIVIHELTHILLCLLKEKYVDLVALKEKQIEDLLKKPEKNKDYISLINSNSKLIDNWILREEENICTMMEHILLKS